MSFPRYAAYKDSEVGWLRDIPAHWGVGQSRRLFALRNDRALGSDRQLTASQKHGVIYQDDYMSLEGHRVVQVLKGADMLKHVEPNDFVISMRSFQGGIEWCNLRGCISSAYVMLVPCDRVHAPFFRYLLKSAFYIQALQTTSNLVRDGQAMRYDNFTQIALPLIPLDEQARIAAFLNRETAKTDELVVEQRRLVELLKEKRQAVVSHAVTKGLDPDAPMKSSSIEWLGDVPDHWQLRRLRFVCDIHTGDKDTEHAVEDGQYPFFVRSQVVERINTVAYDCEAILTAGDGAGVGKVFHYYEGPFDFHQRVYMLNNFREVSGLFLFHFLRENFYKVALEGGAKSTVDSLRRPMFMNFMVCVPPKDEQEAIVLAVREEMAKIDTLTAEAQRAINLLQERRAALISAAVTGQIDVRGFADSKAA